MKKYVVEIVEKITFKVLLDAASSEDAEMPQDFCSIWASWRMASWIVFHLK